MNPVLCPKPKRMEFRPGVWQPDLGKPFTIALPARGAVELAPGTRWFLGQRLLEATGKEIQWLGDGVEEASGACVRVIRHSSVRHDEGYCMNINEDGVELEARSGRGVFYGLATLTQLLRQYDGPVGCACVEDQPDFPRRGVMLDVSRNKMPKTETLLKLIDMFAGFKINQLQLYVEHSFAFELHATVWADSSPLTGDEIEALDQYCRDRYIELVPNLNSFGHLERWFRHPEYHHLAECPKGFKHPLSGWKDCGTTLRPTEEGLSFIDSLYREYLPHFTSKKFNVGCDETWELGQGFSKADVARKSKQRVYLDFLLEIHRLVESYDREMMFWADIILERPELVAKLPSDITGLIWGYERDHPFEQQCRTFRETRVPYYVVPGTSTWNSIGGRLDNALENLENAVRNGIDNEAEGMLITEWGDQGHHQVLPVNYPPFVYGAALAWNYPGNCGMPVEDVLNVHVFEDTTHESGRIACALGRVFQPPYKRLHNKGVLNQILFSQGELLDEVLEGIPVEELEEAQGKAERLGRRILDARPQCDDGELVMRELQLSAGMLAHAAKKGACRLRRNHECLSELRAELALIINSYEEIWLQRNRVGGLHESSQYLRDLQPHYMELSTV